MKPTRKFSQLLKDKKAVGTFCEIPNPVMTSFLADSNLDYVLIDNEHALINIETLQMMVMSMQGKDTQCAVRVPSITMKLWHHIVIWG